MKIHTFVLAVYAFALIGASMSNLSSAVEMASTLRRECVLLSPLKAGLHPFAVLDVASYFGSPMSTGGIEFSGALGKLGEGIGDSFTAYTNNDEIAKTKQSAGEDDALQKQTTKAEIREINARAMESYQRTLPYTLPYASGRQCIAGQVDFGGYSTTGRASSATYAVRPMGDGYYDINFSTEYQQEIGNEVCP